MLMYTGQYLAKREDVSGQVSLGVEKMLHVWSCQSCMMRMGIYWNWPISWRLHHLAPRYTRSLGITYWMCNKAQPRRKEKILLHTLIWFVEFNGNLTLHLSKCQVPAVLFHSMALLAPCNKWYLTVLIVQNASLMEVSNSIS